MAKNKTEIHVTTVFDGELDATDVFVSLIGLLRYQRPFDESPCLHRCDCFPEKRLPFQNRHNWGKEAGGLDCGGGAA